MAIKDLRDNLRRLKEADPVELAGQVNSWLHESGEAIRLRVEDEVEKAVTNRGFVKRSDFQKLEARIAALEGVGRKKSSNSSSTAKKSGVNSSRKIVKKTAKNVVKKAIKKAPAKRGKK